jgi:hypothetical protein
MGLAEVLRFTIAGCLAAVAGLATYALADLLRDTGRGLAQAWRRWRQPRLFAALGLQPQKPPTPTAAFSAAALYGVAGVPWRGLMVGCAAGGLLLMLPLALETRIWALTLAGLLAGLIPLAVRRLKISAAQAAILNQVRDFLLALRLRLVLHVSLTAALREIADTPAELERLGAVGARLRIHVTSAAYERSPEELLLRLAEDLRSAELRTLCRRAQGVRRGQRTYAAALQESMDEVTQEINTRHEQEIESAPDKIIILAGATLFGLLLVLFAMPVLARALATIAGVPGFYVP